MKKFFSFIFTNKILIIILIMVCLVLPNAIVKEAQGDTTVIITGIGIDKKNDEINVSLQLISSQYSLASGQNLEVAEGEGKTVGEALDNISYKLGKELGFEHCGIIILADSVSTTENCKDILDFLYRRANMTLNTLIISTDNQAKEVLNKAVKLENSAGSCIQNNLLFNKKNLNSANVLTMGDFFNDYYSKSQASTMYFVHHGKEAVEQDSSDSGDDDGSSGESSEENEFGGGGSSSSGGGSGSGVQSSELNMVENEGKSAIFKNGTKVATVGKEVTQGLNWISGGSIKGGMFIENVTDDKYYKDASVTIHIRKGKASSKAVFENNKPVLKVSVNITVEIEEINQEYDPIQLSSGYTPFLTDGLKQKIKEEINKQISSTEDYYKTSEIDICGINNKLNKFQHKKYKKWLQSYSEQDILSLSKVETKINIYSYN